MDTGERINQLLDRWDELRNEGIPVTPEDLCQDCPELLDAIKAAVEKLQRAEAWRLAADADADEPPPWEVGTTPVPGHDYRLERKLGEGGFGEVWRAEGPGGFPVAVKRIALRSSAGTRSHEGETERLALEILKRVRHANLIAIHGAFFLCKGARCRDPELADTLAVVMELADGSLLDPWNEGRRAGLPGVPEGTLLQYMSEAAKGLDFLRDQSVRVGDKEGRYAQHLDVKPQNLLLVGNAVAVADFGLARLLGRTVTTGPRAGTPGFIAPEVVRGQISKHSDQYSLAVTYCYLLTSEYPFQRRPVGARLGSIKASELTMLPVGQRDIVARALSETPSERWPSCSEFVAELASRGQGVARKGPGPAPVGDPSAIPETVDAYLNSLPAWDDEHFRRVAITDRRQTALHRDAYAKANELPASRQEQGITFTLVPPATTTQADDEHPYPRDLDGTKAPYFYLSERPVSPEDWARLATQAGQPDLQARNYRAIQAWLQAVRTNVRSKLRLPRPAEWQHAARLGLIEGSRELCAEGGQPYVATYSGVPEPYRYEKIIPTTDLTGWCWRVVLE